MDGGHGRVLSFVLGGVVRVGNQLAHVYLPALLQLFMSAEAQLRGAALFAVDHMLRRSLLVPTKVRALARRTDNDRLCRTVSRMLIRWVAPWAASSLEPGR